MKTKAELRHDLLLKRQYLLKEDLERWHEVITKKIIETPIYQNAQTILLFKSIEGEFDTDLLHMKALSDHKRVGLPRVLEKGEMAFYDVQTITKYELSPFGIEEPDLDSEEILPQDVDLMIVPCVSATKTLKRLGYGGGFYDRYFKKTSAFRLLPIPEVLLEEELPSEPWDVLMDLVLTEEGAYSKEEEDAK